MASTKAIVICSIAAFESLLILTANTFTVYIFWSHRDKLKRTSFLLINLAAADLLIGFAIRSLKLSSSLSKSDVS